MRKVILPNLKSFHMFQNKKILITGGTGSLGTALTARLLKTDVDIILGKPITIEDHFDEYETNKNFFGLFLNFFPFLF